MSIRSVAVFDLGGVLIDWNPRYLYRKLFDGNEGAMEHFLATVCTPSWNSQQDAGRPFAEACASLKSEYPAQAELIDAWIQRQSEMVTGPIHGTVEILAELRARQVPLYALSNWSAETFLYPSTASTSCIGFKVSCSPAKCACSNPTRASSNFSSKLIMSIPPTPSTLTI
jgi:FMN phosphatase YigB (HAD superfamily)